MPPQPGGISAPERRRRIALGAAVVAFIALPLTTLVSTAPRTAAQPLSLDISGLRDGDLIFRRGHSMESRAVLAADRSSEYSHVGILHLGPEGPLVIHAVPASGSGTPEPIRVEPLNEFLRPEFATAAAVWRLDSERLAARAAAAALQYARDRVLFDAFFDLSNSERMYCTEMVWRAYLDAGIDLVEGRFTTVSMPLVRGAVLLPSTLLGSLYLTEVQRASHSQEI